MQTPIGWPEAIVYTSVALAFGAVGVAFFWAIARVNGPAPKK